MFQEHQNKAGLQEKTFKSNTELSGFDVLSDAVSGVLPAQDDSTGTPQPFQLRAAPLRALKLGKMSCVHYMPRRQGHFYLSSPLLKDIASTFCVDTTQSLDALACPAENIFFC